MAKSGMNPKTLQYLMGRSDIGVTLNTYTHLGEEDAKEEMEKMGLLKKDEGKKIRVLTCHRKGACPKIFNLGRF